MTLMKLNDTLFPGISNVLDNPFQEFFKTNGILNKMPAVNIRETKKDYIIELAVPGMKKDYFKISVEGKQLIVSSEKTTRDEEKNEDGAYTRREFGHVSFQRSFSLNNELDADKITARYDNGILYVSVPKKEVEKKKETRFIKIS